MKYTITILLIASINILHSQQIPPSGSGGADSATMYLTGTFTKYNPQRAFQINLHNANNGNAKAMNAVAIQYMKGVGVDSNLNLAIYWFNQAATNNYTKALVNLGMLYKHKAFDSAGYSIACNYFNQALQVGEPSAFFAQGYMLYKGLGCTQSYTAALTLFNQGIALNQANCMYFKGLCYKFGYGVNQNNDTATYYIDKAAQLGYKQANAALANNNTVARITKQSTPNPKLHTNEFENIQKTNIPIKLNGTFKGNLNQYDYSGKKLMAQIPITLNITPQLNKLTGTIQLSNDTPIILQAIQQGNQLIFSQTTAKQYNTKCQTPNNVLIFKTAQLAIETKNDTNYLTGSLQLFNTRTHETEKPINIKLSQQQNKITDNTKLQTPNNVIVYPNPTRGNFNIIFSLSKPSAVKINIYNTQGKLVYTKILEQLQAGKQNIPIRFLNPNLEGREAIYTVTIQTNSFTQSTAFIYEK